MHAEIKKMMASEKENGKMTRLLDGFKSGIRYNENVLVIATTESAAQAFLDNAGTSTVPAWLQDTKYPFLANIDFGAIVKAILAKGGKGGSKGLNEKVFDLFDHITFAGGHLNGNSLEGRFTISFTDKQANAVVQIFDFINYYLEQDAKRKEGM
jgi:hypothetical protein